MYIARVFMTFNCKTFIPYDLSPVSSSWYFILFVSTQFRVCVCSAPRY